MLSMPLRYKDNKDLAYHFKLTVTGRCIKIMLDMCAKENNHIQTVVEGTRWKQSYYNLTMFSPLRTYWLLWFIYIYIYTLWIKSKAWVKTCPLTLHRLSGIDLILLLGDRYLVIFTLPRFRGVLDSVFNMLKHNFLKYFYIFIYLKLTW